MNHSEFLIKRNIYTSPNQGFFFLQPENVIKAFFAQLVSILFNFSTRRNQKVWKNTEVLMVEMRRAFPSGEMV